MLRPPASNSIACSTSTWADSTTTAVSGNSSRMMRAASRPSEEWDGGIRMSVTTKSGANSRTMARSWLPSRACPTTSRLSAPRGSPDPRAAGDRPLPEPRVGGSPLPPESVPERRCTHRHRRRRRVRRCRQRSDRGGFGRVAACFHHEPPLPLALPPEPAPDNISQIITHASATRPGIDIQATETGHYTISPRRSTPAHSPTFLATQPRL